MVIYGDWTYCENCGDRVDCTPAGEPHNHTCRVIHREVVQDRHQSKFEVIMQAVKDGERAAQHSAKHSEYVWSTAATLMAAVSQHGLPSLPSELKERAVLAVKAAVMLENELLKGQRYD
jgi:hypothetical protein